MIGDPHYKLHPDDQGVDRIEIDVVPRFKTSGLSGDEWRVSGRLRVYRKGELVGEKFMSSVDSLANALPYLWMTLPEWTEGPLYDAERGGKCQQAGCDAEAAVEYEIQEEYSARGEGPLPQSVLGKPRRRFCVRHGHRGDADLEDCDANYRQLSGPKVARDDLNPHDLRPAAQVTVQVDSIDDVPGAVKKAVDEFRKQPPVDG